MHFPKSRLRKLVKTMTDMQIDDQVYNELDRFLEDVLTKVIASASRGAFLRGKKRIMIGDVVVAEMNAITRLYHDR